METIALVMFEQALFQITCDTSVVNRSVFLTRQNINVNEIFHLAGLPSRSLGADRAKSKNCPPPPSYGGAEFAGSPRPKAKGGAGRIATRDHGIMRPLVWRRATRP